MVHRSLVELLAFSILYLASILAEAGLVYKNYSLKMIPDARHTKSYQYQGRVKFCFTRFYNGSGFYYSREADGDKIVYRFQLSGSIANDLLDYIDESDSFLRDYLLSINGLYRISDSSHLRVIFYQDHEGFVTNAEYVFFIGDSMVLRHSTSMIEHNVRDMLSSVSRSTNGQLIHPLTQFWQELRELVDSNYVPYFYSFNREFEFHQEFYPYRTGCFSCVYRRHRRIYCSLENRALNVLTDQRDEPLFFLFLSESGYPYAMTGYSINQNANSRYLVVNVDPCSLEDIPESTRSLLVRNLGHEDISIDFFEDDFFNSVEGQLRGRAIDAEGALSI